MTLHLPNLLAAVATPSPSPSPTDLPFDPVDVTPGPNGFFATMLLMLAVGLLAMSLMRRSARANARYDIREQLEREAAEEDAARAAERARPEQPDATPGPDEPSHDDPSPDAGEPRS
jgi:hypothetical protein